MSMIGSVLRKAVEKNRPPDFPLFCFAAAALVIGQVGWALHTDSESLAILRGATAALQPSFVWIDVHRRSLVFAFALSVLGALIVAGLFSNQNAVRPRYAWLGFAIWGAVMTSANAWSSIAPFGGYADRTGATWLNSRAAVDHRPWSAATAVVAGCAEKSNGPRYRLRSDVKFGDRRANLGDKAVMGRMRPWLSDVAAVDASVSPDAGFSRDSFAWRCIATYAGGLSVEEDRTFVALFRPTTDHARWIERESPAWAEIVRDVARGRRS